VIATRQSTRARFTGARSIGAWSTAVQSTAAQSAAAEETLGLPRRVRYGEQEEAASEVAPDHGRTPSSPGEIGALVASLQQGWLDGRNQAGQQDDS